MKWMKNPYLWCIPLCFGVSLSCFCFFWLYSITTVTPFNRWSPRLVISIWLQGPGPGATKMPFFAEIQINCNFFQLQPKRETSFSSLGDNGAFCAKCETRGGENSPPNIVGQTMLGVVICALLAVCFRCDLLYQARSKHKMTGGAERVAHINSPPPASVPRLKHTSWYMTDHYICLH